MTANLLSLALASLALASGAQADTTSTLSASYCSAYPISTTGTGTATGVQYTQECEPMVYVESSGKNLSPETIGAIVGIVVGSIWLFAMIAWTIIIVRRRRANRASPPADKPPMYEFSAEGNALGNVAEKQKWELEDA
ncbi:hypothetical protein K525DRAFT_197366 [Schizophyllum commune Loenen D]|nr:hypothetical protein K525DRAFT_197366 [Schizophyllum commune Loenen D]